MDHLHYFGSNGICTSRLITLIYLSITFRSSTMHCLSTSFAFRLSTFLSPFPSLTHPFALAAILSAIVLVTSYVPILRLLSSTHGFHAVQFLCCRCNDPATPLSRPLLPHVFLSSPKHIPLSVMSRQCYHDFSLLLFEMQETAFVFLVSATPMLNIDD